MPPDAFDSLAEALAGTFPGCDDAPLARALLRALAEGEPVDPATVGQRADGALARWPNLERDEDGRVVAFAGLSLRPTPHRFTVGGRTLYTWCAWDTLFLPALISRSADVESRCPIMGTDVRLAVAPDGILDASPGALRVSFPTPETTSTADITGTFCCHVHFLAGPGAAEQWLARHPAGVVLGLDDAFELGRAVTSCC